MSATAKTTPIPRRQKVKALWLAAAVLVLGLAHQRAALAIAPNAVTGLVDDGQYTSSTTTLSASWDAAVDDGTITEYSYSIGTTAGADDVLTWTSVGTALTFSNTGLTLTGGTQYFINVRALDDETLESTVASTDGITVDDTPPSDITGLADDGATTTSTTDLNATWDASADNESGVIDYEYSVGTSAGATDVANWNSQGVATTVNITGLTLTDGTTYFVNVRAVNGAGSFSNVASTDGITVNTGGGDTTPPDPVANLTDEGATTTSTTTLTATWDAAVDGESTITEYSVSIGTTAGADDVLTWTSVGLALTFSDNTLTLTDGQTYFINVKSINSAGLESAVASTDGIVVNTAAASDTTPPDPVSNLQDEGATTTSTTTLSATWDAAIDGESGVNEYSVSIGTTAGADDVLTWTSVGLALTFSDNTLTLTDGATYFINVRALNGAGLESDVASTDGITVNTAAASDTTTPSPVVNLQDEGDVTTSTDTLGAFWEPATDGESGINRYEYSIGTTAGATDVLDWTSAGSEVFVSATGLVLSGGVTYFINVKAINGAGLESDVASTDGITVNESGAGGGEGGADNPTPGGDSFSLAFNKNFWELVTFPIDGSSLDISQLASQGVFNLYGYDAEKTADAFGQYTTPANLPLGEGFFVYSFEDDLSLNVTGDLPAATGALEKTLKTGWNMVGNPRDQDLALNSLKVKDDQGNVLGFADAVSQGLVQSRLYGYGLGGYLNKDPGAELERRKGYFIHAQQPVSLVWEPATAREAAAGLNLDSLYALKVSFTLSSEGQVDRGDTLGLVSGGVSAARLAVNEPPQSPGGKVRLRLTQGGKDYAVLPVDASAAAATWTLVAEAPAAATLAWTSRAPSGCTVTMTPAQGGATSLDQDGSLGLAAGVNTFTVSANCLGSQSAGVPVTRTLSAPVAAVWLAGNLTAQQAAGLKGYRMDASGAYQEVDLTRDLTGPTPVLLVGGNGADVPTRVSAAASVEAPVAPGWNLVSNLLSTPITFTSAHVAFKPAGGAATPLAQATEWVDDKPWLIGADGEPVEVQNPAGQSFAPGESFIVYSNAAGTLVISQ